MLDRLVSYIAPHECPGCKTEGSLLCSACQTRVNAIPERCYKCLSLSPDSLSCQKCRRTGLPYRISLQRHGQSRQGGTTRKERVDHLQKAFQVLRPQTG